MTTKTSRRAILAGAASLPALAVPALALSGNSNSDPVFAAIERHKAEDAVHAETCSEYSRLQDANRDATGAFIDTPEVVEAEVKSDRACDAADAALAQLVATTPTTIAGCTALLLHVEAYVTEPGQGNLFESFRNIEEPARTLLSRIAGVLAVQS